MDVEIADDGGGRFRLPSLDLDDEDVDCRRVVVEVEVAEGHSSPCGGMSSASISIGICRPVPLPCT